MPVENELNKEDVTSALNEVEPALQADGGDVELVDSNKEWLRFALPEPVLAVLCPL